MAYSGSSEFVEHVRTAFAPLVTEFGFETPVVDDFGREVFVRYHRGNRTISISMESGARPIIEFFYPSAETGERTVAWAQRNGVERARRFPRPRGLDWGQPPLETQLERAFAALRDEEMDFLRSW